MSFFQAARESAAYGGLASSSKYSSAWARDQPLTSFNDFPQLRPQKEKVDYEESESESESESEHEDDERDDHEQHAEGEAEDEDEIEIKPDEDDSLFVGQDETPNVEVQENREDSPSPAVETATPSSATRPDTHARASITSQASATPTKAPAYTKYQKDTPYSTVLGAEHKFIKGHLIKFISTPEAAQVAHEDRFDALWKLRHTKLLERENRGTMTTRTHKDPRSKKSDEEERRWIRTTKDFVPYLKGGSQKPAGFGKHMNTAKDIHDEHDDQDDEEPLPAKPEEQEDDEMPDYTETGTEEAAAITPSERTWQIHGGQMVVWPPFEDGADPDRWRSRQRTGHWAAQESVPAVAERSKFKGECSIM